MIEELEIRDLGVIAHSVLPLSPGFTAITGETGAGKTMVVAALGLLMGARSDAGAVRRGAERARITGIVRTDNSEVMSLTEGLGGEVSDGELILTRTVSAEGRSRASVGGSATPASALSNIAPFLFAVHGQSEQLRLRSPAAQRDMVDRFGGQSLLETLERHATVFRRRESAQEQLDDLVSEQRDRIREAEQLRAEVEEISRAEPIEGEVDELMARIERLGNIESLREAAEHARAQLTQVSDDPFVKDAVSLVAQAITELGGVLNDPELGRIHDLLSSAQVQLTEAASDLATFSHGLDEEGPEELARTQARLDTLTVLTRKYGDTTGEVLRYEQRALQRLAELDGDDSTIEQLRAELFELSQTEESLAKELTRQRTEAAGELGHRVTSELRELALPDAMLTVSVTPQAPGPHGRDSIEVLLAPHAGSDPRPIHKGASGGELSRIMLALEVTIAEVDPVPTFVFDEVDAGVGGQAAIEIGRRLRRLAETSQVIVVTHLAQVAAFAHHHLRISKDSAGGFTESSALPVTGEERLQEMARLLSGMSSSESALEHARELLALGES